MASDATYGQRLRLGFAVGRRLGLRHRQFHVQQLQRASAKHCQRAVRRHFAQGFFVIKIISELGHIRTVFILALGQAAVQTRLLPQPFAHQMDQACVLCPSLGQQIANTVQHRLYGRKICAFNRISRQHKTQRFVRRIELRLGEQFVCQRFQARFTGNHAFGAALRLVRQIQIFQFLLGRGHQQSFV